MTEDRRYNIVFRGELVSGADPAQVRENLCQLFKMDAERVEKLFVGKPVVVKKNTDQTTAMKMRAMLKKAGAECQMQPVDEDGAASGGANASVQTPAGSGDAAASAQPAGPANAATTDDRELVGTIRTGGTGFSSEFEVAPAGADLEQSHNEPAAVNPDTSHLTMAEPGADLEQLADDREVEVPDTSHLHVVDER